MRETALIMRDFSSSYQPPLPHLNQIQFLIRILIHSTIKKERSKISTHISLFLSRISSLDKIFIKPS